MNVLAQGATSGKDTMPDTDTLDALRAMRWFAETLTDAELRDSIVSAVLVDDMDAARAAAAVLRTRV